MIHFPELLPDESLYSFVGRLARLNGLSDHMAVCGTLFGDVRVTSVADCLVDFDYLCAISKGVYGSPRKLMDSLTMAPVLRHLGMNFHGVRAPEALLVGNSLEAKNVQFGLLEISMGESPRWRICSQCRERDIRLYGTAYWHRVHLLPTSIYCPEHGIRLIEKNLPRRRLHDHLWLPDEAPDLAEINACLFSQDLQATWLEVSILGREALWDCLDSHPDGAIREAFLVGMRQKGLLKSNGKIRLSAYQEGVASKFQGDVIQSESTYLLRGVMNNRLGNPMLRLLLVHWLFGSWQHFKDRCLWESVMGNRSDNTELMQAQSKGKSGDIKILTLNYRQVCLDYKKNNPNATRLAFLRFSNRAFIWLLRHDSSWLAEQMPFPNSIRKQKELFSD